MATQFSSSDDIFSKLPDHIIHCILGFLPRTKDVVRTSAISKSCLQAWRTFPLPRFNLNEFISHEQDEAKMKQFIRFVDSSLQRFARQNEVRYGNEMKIFNLITNSNVASHHSNRWIGMALDNKVEHLAVRLDYTPLEGLIPDSVLSAYWLKSLKLYGCMYLPLTEGSPVHLPSLTSLSIKYSHIRVEELQKLLGGCPALEDIALLDCLYLSEVDIFDHPNLETLEVTGCISAIRVKAPKMKSFCYTSNDKDDVIVKIHYSPKLKSLKIGHQNMSDEWFHKFVAQFPLIENLTIYRCNALRKIRISNPLLEKIDIMYCNNLEDVLINCKKLASFALFTKPSSLSNPSSIQMEMDNPPNDCTTQITIEPFFDFGECDLLMKANWYSKLKEFLTKPATYKGLGFHMEPGYDADGEMKWEDVHKKLPPAACDIEKLSLDVRDNVPFSWHSYYLNGLLSACHPTIIELQVFSNSPFVKLVCEEFGNRENNSKCWCKDDFKCWKHQLKEVKIEKITGISVKEDLNWDALFDLLPTLKFGNNIYFNLMW